MKLVNEIILYKFNLVGKMRIPPPPPPDVKACATYSN